MKTLHHDSRYGLNSHFPKSKALLEANRDASEKAFYQRRIDWGLARVTGWLQYRDFCKLAALRPKVDNDPEIDAIAREAHKKSMWESKKS